EYVPGVRYTDAAGHLSSGVDPARLIRLGIQGVLEHTLVYGIFHGDLHAGNVFIDHDGTFSLLDFGIVGRLDAVQRAALVRFMIGVGTFDTRGQLDALVEFGAIPLAPGLDLLGEVDPIFQYFKGKYEDALPYFGR